MYQVEVLRMNRVNRSQEKTDMGKVVEYLFQELQLYIELALVVVFRITTLKFISAEICV